MKYWILLFGSILLFGCGDGLVSLTDQADSLAYDRGHLSYAAAGRDFRVVIVGDPFDGGRPEVERAVTDTMQEYYWGQRTHFTVEPGETARDAYRVVMLFNPPASLLGDKLCQDDAAMLSPRADTDSRLSLYAAFCRSDKHLTSVRGRIKGASGPDDPLFLSMVGQVTLGLFPPQQEDQDDN